MDGDAQFDGEGGDNWDNDEHMGDENFGGNDEQFDIEKEVRTGTWNRMSALVKREVTTWIVMRKLMERKVTTRIMMNNWEMMTMMSNLMEREVRTWNMMIALVKREVSTQRVMILYPPTVVHPSNNVSGDHHKGSNESSFVSIVNSRVSGAVINFLS